MGRDLIDSGYLRIGHWRGAPIRLHWSLPVGMLVFTGLRVAPAAWLAFAALLLIHELGHAWLARRFGRRVLGVDLTGFGGVCRWSAGPNAYERGVVAWGGVAAQAVLLTVTLLWVAIFGRPTTAALADVVSVFVGTSVWLMALNLLPIRPLDGAEAWPVARAGLERLRLRFRPGLGGVRWPRRTSTPARPPARDNDVAAAFRRIADEAARARSRR